MILDIAAQMPEKLAEYIKKNPRFQEILDAKMNSSIAGKSYAGASYDSSVPLHVGYATVGYTIIAMERGEKIDGINMQKGRCLWESKSGRSFILDSFSELGTRKKFVRIQTFRERVEALGALKGNGETKEKV